MNSVFTPPGFDNCSHFSELPELIQLQYLLAKGAPHVAAHVIAEPIDERGRRFPIHSLQIGSRDKTHPTLVLIGGVHGVERIGSQVILAFLETLVYRLQWDDSLHRDLENLRILMVPIVNPIGMLNNTRSNGNGVDLMRNAPVDAEQKTPFLVGGQRLSSVLPWYRGKAGHPMEKESAALYQEIISQLQNSTFSLVLDCHSGFGFEDRIWFPYARSKERHIDDIGLVYQLRQLLQTTYPHLNYIFEPQALHYTTHGDLWDYLYETAQPWPGTFIPLTLEMGSWRWVKKNPRQLLRSIGMFNPILPHRLRRVLRSHQVLMEFLIKATHSNDRWQRSMDPADAEREAVTAWYHTPP